MSVKKANSTVRLALLAAATLVFLINPIEGAEIKLVCPSPWADVEATNGGLHSGPPQGARSQQVLAAEDFVSLPEENRVLTALRFRSDGAGEGEGTWTMENMLMRISTTETAVGELSPTYADNWGDDLTTVWQGDMVMSFSHIGPVGGPKEFDTPIQLQTPFVYDPSAGNLLIDRRWTGVRTVGNVSFDFLDDTDQSYTQYIAHWPPDGTQAQYSGGGHIYEFTFVSSADFDRDGDVDGDDFLIWQAAFGNDDSGDADFDGDTDGDDFLIWQSQFGSADGSATEAVPEPVSIILLLLTALAGGVFVKRRHEYRTRNVE